MNKVKCLQIMPYIRELPFVEELKEKQDRFFKALLSVVTEFVSHRIVTADFHEASGISHSEYFLAFCFFCRLTEFG